MAEAPRPRRALRRWAEVEPALAGFTTPTEGNLTRRAELQAVPPQPGARLFDDIGEVDVEMMTMATGRIGELAGAELLVYSGIGHPRAGRTASDSPPTSPPIIERLGRA